MKTSSFAALVGTTITNIRGAQPGSQRVWIDTDAGTFGLAHDQDCCESVQLAEVHGDPAELVGGRVVFACESSSGHRDAQPDVPGPDAESFTWTFYRLMTDKATLVLRWLGQSNGCYSESVSFFREEDEYAWE